MREIGQLKRDLENQADTNHSADLDGMHPMCAFNLGYYGMAMIQMAEIIEVLQQEVRRLSNQVTIR